eukprot:TCONS_00002172-protein
MVKRNLSERSDGSTKLSKKDSIRSTGSSTKGPRRKESFKSSKKDGFRSPEKEKRTSKKKSTVSFNVSPRVEKIPNPKKRSVANLNQQENNEETPELSHNDSRTSYIPFEEENSLPELSQAVIQKKMGKMIHLLDTRPMNYVCVTDRRNRNCLHYAAYLGYTEILETLLNRTDAHKIINAKDDSGKTPLFKAAETSSLACVEILLNHGSDVTIQDNDGISVMHVATLADNAMVMKTLWKHKADLNTKDKLGFTPLHLAAGLGLRGPTHFLLRHGAVVDPIDGKGRTPLLAAAADKNVEIIEILLQHGANATIQDDRGRTAKNIFSTLTLDRRFSDIQPTRTTSSHHFPFEMITGRTNSFINDIKKVHDQGAVDDASRRGSTTITPRGSAANTPKFDEMMKGPQFSFDEKDIEQHQEQSKPIEKVKDESSYKNLISPINWKNILESPRRLKKSFSRSDSNKYTQKSPTKAGSTKRSSLKRSKAVVDEDLIIPQLEFDLAQMDAEDNLSDRSRTSSRQGSFRSRTDSINSVRQQAKSYQAAPSPRMGSAMSQRSFSDPNLDRIAEEEYHESNRPSSRLSQRSQPDDIEREFLTNQQLQNSYTEPSYNNPPLQPSGDLNQDVHLNQQLQQISLSASQLSQQLQMSIQSRLSGSSVQPQTQPQILTPQPTLVTHQPTVATPQPVLVTPQPTLMTPQPTFVTPQPSVVIPQPLVTHQAVQVTPRHIHISQPSIPQPSIPQPYQYNLNLSSSSQFPSRQQPSYSRQNSQQADYSHSQNSKHRNSTFKRNVSIEEPISRTSDQGRTHTMDQTSTKSNVTPAFEEDRYLYMCLKNRELLLKKIKQCEDLESEIKNGQTDEHNNASSEHLKETSLIDENSALRDELRELKKENLTLNEHILFNKRKKPSRSRGNSRSRSRSQSRSRSRSRSKSRERLDQSRKNLPDPNRSQQTPDSEYEDLERENSTSDGEVKPPERSRRRGQDSRNTEYSDEGFSPHESEDESEYSYSEGDSYFQETINKLLKENILLKRSHKAYERCHKELEDEVVEHKTTIKNLEEKLQEEEKKREKAENDYEELQKAHIALEQAHIELDYGMKKMLEDNVDMRKDLTFLQIKKEKDSTDKGEVEQEPQSSFRKAFNRFSPQDGGKQTPPKRPDPPTRPTSGVSNSTNLSKDSTTKPKIPERPKPFADTRQKAIPPPPSTSKPSSRPRSVELDLKPIKKKKKRRKMFILF